MSLPKITLPNLPPATTNSHESHASALFESLASQKEGYAILRGDLRVQAMQGAILARIVRERSAPREIKLAGPVAPTHKPKP